MDIRRNGSQPSNQGASDYFTGSVRIDPLIDAPAPARVFGAYVTFEPGAVIPFLETHVRTDPEVLFDCGETNT